MKIFSRFQNFFASLARPYPARDWFLVLATVLGVFLLLTLYAVYLFFAIESGALFVAENQSGISPTTVTREEIRTVLERYQTRELNYNARNLPAPVVVDPAK